MVYHFQWNRKQRTLPVKPVVIPQPLIRSGGLSNADQWHLSSSRSALDPSAPLDLRPVGAARAHFGHFKPTSDCVTRPGSMRPDSSREPKARCCHTTTLQAPQTAMAVTDGSAPSVDHNLQFSTQFCQPPSHFPQVVLIVVVIDGVSYSCTKQYIVAETFSETTARWSSSHPHETHARKYTSVATCVF